MSKKNPSFLGPNDIVTTNTGHPDPHDEGDNNMVSEGSLYAVSYYNVLEEELGTES
ncbi:hypothetical protein IC620_08115 [Hazenella sp. IB182357]|uniref:Uncharacterized protein n=1 Tax=Polycladospora coralii TaxID=2771432 RepID=A0A926N610_9BACL|nr:hypothetical protein [Polycladospora coralii]MBD1372319.1 hypothetical protein [Polycladospora coralii]MBS7531491.1 hypothetical protein [Polycladospora coralii]